MYTTNINKSWKFSICCGENVALRFYANVTERAITAGNDKNQCFIHFKSQSKH